MHFAGKIFFFFWFICMIQLGTPSLEQIRIDGFGQVDLKGNMNH